MGYSAKPAKVLKTSIQFYNCALHTLIPYVCSFIDPKITQSNDFSFAEVKSTTAQRRAFRQSKGYQYLLEAFSECYGLDEQRYTQRCMLSLLKEHANPRDLQVLLGSALRLTLQKVLLDSNEHKENIKPSFETLIASCQEKYLSQSRNIRQRGGMNGKIQCLSNLRWSQEEEHEELFKPNIDIIAQLMGQDLSRDWSAKWDEAYNNYIAYQCAPENQTFITEAQLGMLSNSFGFDFAYTSRPVRLNRQKNFTLISTDNTKPLATVLVQNPSRDHWEILAQNTQTHWDMSSAQALENSRFENYHQLSLDLLREGAPTGQIAELQNKFKTQVKQYIVEGKAYSDNAFQSVASQLNIAPRSKVRFQPNLGKKTPAAPKAKARERHWSLLRLPQSNINPNMQVIAYHLDVALSTPRWNTISQSKGIKILLDYFQRVYDKPNWQWDNFAKALAKQSHPEDRQFVWFFPLSNYLQAISKDKKYNSHKLALERLCQNLGLHVQAYQNLIPLVEPMFKAQEIPKLLGAHIKQSNIIIPVMERGGIWSLMTNNHQYAAIYNNLMMHGRTQLHGLSDIGVDDANNILNKENAPKHIGNIAQKIINGEEKYTLFSKALASSEHRRLNFGIKNILESNNVFLIATAATLHPDVRNKLLLQPKKYGIALSILHKAESLMGRNFEIKRWMKILDGVVPCVLRLEGDTVLHKAIRNKDEAKVKELLQVGVDFYDINKYGNTALHLACYYGMESAIFLMNSKVLSEDDNKFWYQELGKGLNIDLQNSEGQTPVHLAAQHSNALVMQTLLGTDRNPTNFSSSLNGTDKQGRTALHVAAQHGEKEVLQCLLDYIKRNNSTLYPFIRGYKIIDAQDSLGFTALHYATYNSNFDNISGLLSIGASVNVNANPKFKQSALQQLDKEFPASLAPFTLALELQNSYAIYKMISFNDIEIHDVPGIKYLSNISVENSKGFNAVGIFALQGNVRLLKHLKSSSEYLLLQLHTIFRTKDSQGREPIHAAAMGGSLEAFSLILGEGKHLLQLSDNEGNTPLHYAAEYGHVAIVKEILRILQNEKDTITQHRNDIQSNSNFIKNNFYRGKKYTLALINGQSDINAKNNNGETPYMLAKQYQHKAAELTLLMCGADSSGLEAFILNAIANPNKHKLPANELAEKVAKDQYEVARIAAKHGVTSFDDSDSKVNLITEYTFKTKAKAKTKIKAKTTAKAKTKDAGEKYSGNTFVHFCAIYQAYTYLNILLHPLTHDERAKWCNKENDVGQTALDIIRNNKKALEQEKTIPNAELDKIERLLVMYTPSIRKNMSYRVAAGYQYSWKQDYKNDVMSTSGYYWASKGMYWGPFAFKAIEAGYATGYLWFAAEAATQHFTGGDILYNTERVLRLANDGLMPEGKCHTAANKAIDILSYSGWITQFNNRAAAKIIQYSASTLGYYCKSSRFASLNYIDEMNKQGFLLGLGEGAYRQWVAPKVNETLGGSGLDSMLLPKEYTINALLSSGLQAANDKFAERYKVNIQAHLKDIYLKARTLSGVPKEGQVFDDEFADDLIKEWGIEDEDYQQEMLAISKILFESSYNYREAERTHNQLAILTHYAQTGVAIDATITLFAEAAVLMSAKDIDASSSIFKLVTNSTYINGINLKDDGNQGFNDQLAKDLAEIDYSDTDTVYDKIKNATLKNHYGILAQNIEENTANLSENLSFELVQVLIKEQIAENEEMGYQLHHDINTLLAFASSGLIYGDEDKLLGMLNTDDASSVENFVKIYTSSYAFSLFGFDAELTQEHQALLEKSLQDALSEQSNTTSNEDVAEADQESSQVLKDTIQTLDEVFVASFMENNILSHINENELNLGSEMADFLKVTNLPILNDTWNDPAARQVIISGLYNYLSGSGDSATQSQYISTLIDQAQTQGLDPSNAIKLVFENSGFVRLTNLGDEFIEGQTKVFEDGLNNLNSPDNNSTISELLDSSIKTFVDKFVDVRIINGAKDISIDDAVLLNYIRVGVTEIAINNINKPEQFNESMANAFNLIFNGEITEDNIETLSQLAEIVVTQSNDGTDINDVMTRFFFHSPEYTSKNFSEEENKAHQTTLLQEINSSDKSTEALLSAFQSNRSNINFEFAQSNAKQFIDDNIIGKLDITDPEQINLLHTGLLDLIVNNGDDSDKLNDTMSGVWEILQSGLVTEDNLETFIEISQIEGRDSNEVMAYFLIHSSLYVRLNFSPEIAQKHAADLVTNLNVAKENGESLLHVFEASRANIETDYNNSFPVLALDANAIVSDIYAQSIGQANPQQFMAEQLSEQTLAYHYKLDPGMTESEAQYYNDIYLTSYLGTHNTDRDANKNTNKLVGEYNSNITNIENIAVGKLVQNNLDTTQDFNTMYKEFPQTVVNLLHIPEEFQADVALLFQGAVGEFYGQPEKLIERVTDLISAFASPAHETKDGFLAIERTSFALMQSSPDHDFGTIVARSTYAAATINGGNPTWDIEEQAFAINERGNNAVPVHQTLNRLYDRSYPTVNNPGTSPVKIDAENISNTMFSKSNNKVPAFNHLQEHFDAFADSSPELQCAINVFCSRYDKKNGLANGLEIVITLNSFSDEIKMFNNGENLNSDVANSFSIFKPRYLAATYVAQMLCEFLSNNEQFRDMTDMELLEVAAELTRYSNLSSIEGEIKRVLSSHCLSSINDFEFDAGISLEVFSNDLAEKGNSFGTRDWNDTDYIHTTKLSDDIASGGFLYHAKRFFENTASVIFNPNTTGGIQFTIDSDMNGFAGFKHGNQFQIFGPKPIAPPLFTLHQGGNNSWVINTQASQFDIEAAFDNIPDYLKYPMGKSDTSLMAWFTEIQDNTLDGLLPTKFDATQLSYMVAPPLITQPANVNGANIGEILDSALNVHPSMTTGGVPVLSGLQACGLGDERYWQTLDTNSVAPVKYSTAEWFDLLLRSSLGEKSLDVTQWQEFNRSETPEQMLKAFEGVRDSTIPINELPGVFGEAAASAAVGLVEGGIAAVVFIGEDVGRGLTGQDLETVKAVKLLSTFVGEEKARFLMGQELEVTKFARELAQTFDQMDKKERVKALAELGFSLAIPSVGIVKGTSKVVEIGENLAKEASLFTKPVTFTPGYNTITNNLLYGASNAANAVRMKTVFAFQEAGILTKSEKLTQIAIDSARPAMAPNSKFINKTVIKALTEDGSIISDWKKMKTNSITLPTGQRTQIHFYQNQVTQKINYTHIDFKVKSPVEGLDVLPRPQNSKYKPDTAHKVLEENRKNAYQMQ